jgi:hypothetical protein
MKLIIVLIYIVAFLSFNSCVPSQEYQSLEYNWKQDIIGQLGIGFKPEKNNTQWALLKGNNFYKTSIVLFNNSNMEEKNLKYSPDGFFHGCHPTGCSYYIVTKRKDNIEYINDEDSLLKFLGEIDSVEEALLIAIMNGFQIDPNNKKGSSYRVTSNTFEFSLMKPHPIEYRFQQYIVIIDKLGNVEVEEKEFYCDGPKDCEKL